MLLAKVYSGHVSFEGGRLGKTHVTMEAVSSATTSQLAYLEGYREYNTIINIDPFVAF